MTNTLLLAEQFLIGFVALSFLVFIHELGHFLAARFFKVRVNQFSIGFGKTLLSYQGKTTLYSLKLFPFGGFVAMQGEYQATLSSQEPLKNTQDSFSTKPIWQRISIALAGPLVNILFSFFVLTFVFWNGSFETKPQSVIVHSVAQKSIAQEIGIQPQDQILKLGNKEVVSTYDFYRSLQLNGLASNSLTILRQKEEQTLPFKPVFNEDDFVDLGIIFTSKGILIAKVFPNTPAQIAQLKKK